VGMMKPGVVADSDWQVTPGQTSRVVSGMMSTKPTIGVRLSWLDLTNSVEAQVWCWPRGKRCWWVPTRTDLPFRLPLPGVKLPPGCRWRRSEELGLGIVSGQFRRSSSSVSQALGERPLPLPQG